MADLFLSLLNASISASYLVLAVIFLRLVLKKAPKWLMPALWGLVALRLLFPISVESVLSLVPSGQAIPPDIAYARAPAIDSGIPQVNSAVNRALTTFTPDPTASVNPMQLLLEGASWIWAAGVAVMVLYSLVSYLGLRRRVRGAGLVEKGIYRSRAVESPFVLGLFRPRIYLPMSTPEEDAFYIVAHERAHLRRRDHLWKPLGFALLALHWFNPLMWLAYILLCRDIELACDERVIRQLGHEGRADYSQALLSCTVRRRTIAACPLAFGEVGVKQRVKSVLNYKKPGFWIVSIAVVASIIVAVCFLTDPVKTETLTLKDVRRLAQKGERLSRSDFDGFTHQEIGHGFLRICRYQMAEPFYLDVIDDGTEEFHVRLCCSVEGDNGIEIHSGNLETFVKIHSQPLHPYADNHWRIQLGAQDITPTGATVTFSEAYAEERIEASYTCDEHYAIQTKLEDGSWGYMPERQTGGWPGVSYDLFDSAGQIIDWEWLYGALPDGDYRLIKYVQAFYGAEEPGRFEVWTEFGLRNGQSAPMTPEDLLALLKNPENLDWPDFDAFLYWENYLPEAFPENMHYMRHYQVGPNLSLHISGSGPDEPIHRLLLQCDSEENEMAFLYPQGPDPDYWDRGKSRTKWDALGMEEFIGIHDKSLADEHTSHWGVSFRLDSVSSVGAEVSFRADPPEGHEILASDQYRLYSVQNGLWEEVPTLEGREWGTYVVSDEYVSDRSIRWEDRYGVLPAGRYRLEVDLVVRYPEESHIAQEGYPRVSAEFTLDDAAPAARAGDPRPFDPKEIHDLTSAWLEMGDEQYLVTQEESLRYLESLLSTVKTEKGRPGCPFSSTLYLARADGEIFTVQHAEDSCYALVWGDLCYSYDPGFGQDVWQVFGIEPYYEEKTRDEYGRVIRREAFEWFRPVPGSLVEYDYDMWGNLIREERLDENGEVEDRFEYSYDSRGNQIRWMHTRDDGQKTVMERTFDDENRLLTEIGYDENGQVGTETVYTYDALGRVQQILETYRGQHWSDRRYQWEDDTHYRVYHHGSRGEILYSFGCTNNDQGKLVKEVFYNAQGRMENWKEFEYPQDSEDIYVSFYDADGTLVETYRDRPD